MTAAPLVSIIIPSYNYGFVIAETIASLQKQTITNWEALIVDDGSADNTEAVVHPLALQDARITYIKQKNAGVSAARNRAMKLAKGEFIQFLDADDLLSPQKLEIHTNYLLLNPTESLVYSNVRYFKHSFADNLLYTIDGNSSTPLDYKTIRANEAVEHLFVHNIVPICAPLFRREIVDRIGLYDELLTSLEDWDYWFRVAIAGYNFSYLDDDSAWALIRVHKGSLSWNWDNMAANRTRLKANMDKAINENVSDADHKTALLAKSEHSAILYFGYTVFMNIKYHNLGWGIKKAFYWATKFKHYKYFMLGGLVSLKVRVVDKLSTQGKSY